MRTKLALSVYVAFVVFIAYSLAVSPAQAFVASSSTTGYVRTASSAAVSAYQGAKAVAQAEAIAAAVVGTGSGVSVALRIVAGASWPALGVIAGLTLLQIYLSGSQTDDIKAASAPAGPWSIPGYVNPSGLVSFGNCPGASQCVAGFDQVMVASTSPGASAPWGTLSNGWSNRGVDTDISTNDIWYWRAVHDPGFPSTMGTIGASAPPTASQIAAWIEANPSTLTSNLTTVGQQVSPTPADNVVTQSATTTEIPTTVVPAGTVSPTDLVVDPNAQKPSQTTSTQTTNQTTTTTTTTTTNPDGSTTKTDAVTAVQSCTSGNHEQRTAGSILQDHMTVWGGSGLVGALNLLKTLTWPSTPPTYTLTSSLWGTYTLDFSPWNGMLTAIRSIIIAIAGFVAYRIIFVGSK